MADAPQIRSNAAELLRKFDRLPAALQTAVERGMKRGLLLSEEEVRKGADLNFSGSRSGLLSRLTSVVHASHTGAVSIEGRIGFRKTAGYPYEYAQEFGADAKPGKAMVVPISDQAKFLSERGEGPRDFPGELFRPPNTRVLATRQGPYRLQIHYVLFKHLKPRLHFRDSVEASMDDVAKEMVKEFAGEMVKE